VDFDKLVDQITQKVAQEIDSMGSPQENIAQKPKLLLACCGQSDICKSLMDDSRLRAVFAMEYVDINAEGGGGENFDTLVLCDLSCEDMAKIAYGIADGGCAGIAVKAVLSDKCVYVAKEGVELFKYKGCAPKLYYNMMLDKLNLMDEYGIKFFGCGQLAEKILKGNTGSCAAVKCDDNSPDVSRQRVLEKKLVTEKDVVSACTEGYSALLVDERAIITDLAREQAKSRDICIIKK